MGIIKKEGGILIPPSEISLPKKEPQGPSHLLAGPLGADFNIPLCKITYVGNRMRL